MKAFYDSIRKTLFGGSLSQDTVNNINMLVAESRKYRTVDNRQLAYVLATVYHETAHTMEPVEETGRGRDKPYGRKLKYGKGPNKRVAYSLPDQLYYGRGHTQNTWFEIYEKLTKANKNGWDFLNHPELLLQPEPSVWATLYAMTTGLYTGRKLSDHINAYGTDYLNARSIINGTDKAELIMGYTLLFYKALTIDEKNTSPLPAAGAV